MSIKKKKNLRVFYSIESLFRINQAKLRRWFLSAFLLCMACLPRARWFCSAPSLVGADLSSALHSTLYNFRFFILLKIQVSVILRECLLTISGTLPAASWWTFVRRIFNGNDTVYSRPAPNAASGRMRPAWLPSGTNEMFSK